MFRESERPIVLVALVLKHPLVSKVKNVRSSLSLYNPQQMTCRVVECDLGIEESQ
jgi:hypothetical protein